MDQDISKSLSYHELVHHIQECWKQGKAIAARNSAEATDALSKVSAAMRNDKVWSQPYASYSLHLHPPAIHVCKQVQLQQAFERFDVVGSGSLGLPEFVSMLRALMPRLSTKELR